MEGEHAGARNNTELCLIHPAGFGIGEPRALSVAVGIGGVDIGNRSGSRIYVDGSRVAATVAGDLGQHIREAQGGGKSPLGGVGFGHDIELVVVAADIAVQAVGLGGGSHDVLHHCVDDETLVAVYGADKRAAAEGQVTGVDLISVGIEGHLEADKVIGITVAVNVGGANTVDALHRAEIEIGPLGEDEQILSVINRGGAGGVIVASARVENNNFFDPAFSLDTEIDIKIVVPVDVDTDPGVAVHLTRFLDPVGAEPEGELVVGCIKLGLHVVVLRVESGIGGVTRQVHPRLGLDILPRIKDSALHNYFPVAGRVVQRNSRPGRPREHNCHQHTQYQCCQTVTYPPACQSDIQ